MRDALSEGRKDTRFLTGIRRYQVWHGIVSGLKHITKLKEKRYQLPSTPIQIYIKSGIITSRKLVPIMPKQPNEDVKKINNTYLYGFSSWEQSIAVQLSKVMSVSFSRVDIFKGISYPFLMGRPEREFTEQFLLDRRELLVVFGRQGNFDGRLFDFVDKTLGTYNNRLDRLCVVLISPDNDVEKRVRQHVRDQPESRLIIPFSHAEFRNLEIGSLFRHRLQEFFFGRDLFDFQSPLKDETYFFGRQNEIQFYYEKYRSGENAGLFGLRKIGKTSVLYAIRRYLKLRDEPSVLIDCQDPSFHLRRWNSALKYIVDKIRSEYQVPAVVARSGEALYEEVNASLAFEQDLKAISHWLNDRRILLIFDELESISFNIGAADHWKSGEDFLKFWRAIRAVFQRNQTLFSFLVTGVNPLAVETPMVNGTDNPIFRGVVTRYLGFFSVPDVKEMLTFICKYMGVQLSDEIFTYLTDDFGGHPFLIRQATSLLNRSLTGARPVEVSRYTYANERLNIGNQLHDYVEQIMSVLKTWYPIEYELLEALALGDQKLFEEYVFESPTFIRHLEGYGLTQQVGNKHYFRIQVVKEYLLNQAKYKAKLNTKAEKWAEISERRNLLEERLRRGIKFGLSFAFGNDAKQKVCEVVSPKQKAKFDLLSYDEVFESRRKELYFEDLRKIVNKYWDNFSNIFSSDKAKFNQYMEYINKHRADAHADDVPDDEIGTLRIALEWLEDKCAMFN